MLPPTLDRSYEYLRLLGKGGMGRVLLCRHRQLDRLVAVKLMEGDASATSPDRRRFLREARISATLHHPNVVEIYEVGQGDDFCHIAMEYVEGSSLETRLEEGLSLHDGLPLLAAVARALEAAHEADVLHRDLSPSNVLVSTKGVVKVADWGLARPLREESKLTKTGIILGTPYYMAPEQIESKALSPATDLYALGIILYRLTTGRLPFSDDRTMQVLLGHLNEKPAAAEGPPALTRLLDDLLEKSPARRLQSAGEVATRLEALSRRWPPDAHAPVERPAVSKMKRTGRGKLATAIAVLTLCLVVLGGTFRRGHFAGSPEGTEDAGEAFHLRPPEAARSDRLAFRFRGLPPPGPWTLECTGPGALGPLPSILRPELARQVSKSTRLLELDLPAPLLAVVDLGLRDGEGRPLGGPWRIDPSPLVAEELERLFRPLEELSSELRHSLLLRIRGLVDEIHERSLPWQEGNRRMAELLEERGLTDAAFAPLRRALPPYLKGPAPLRRAIEKRLMPLRFMDAALSRPKGAPPPWGITSTLLGHRFHELQLKDGAARTDWGLAPLSAWTFPRHDAFCRSLLPERWSSVASQRFTTSPPDGLPEWLWMTSRRNRERAASGIGGMVMAGRTVLVAEALGERCPGLNAVSHRCALTIPETLPPGHAIAALRLDVLLRFRPALALVLTLGRDHELWLFNDYHLHPERRGSSQHDPFVLSAPLPVELLRPGILPIELRVEGLPFQQDIDTLAVDMIGLRMLVRPRSLDDGP